MTVGDPRKAFVLAAIALVVVCAAVYRSIPSAGPAVPIRVPDATASVEDLPTLADDVANSVSVDPFSHPDLAESASEAPKTQQQQAEKAAQRREIGVGVIKDRETIFGPLPPAGNQRNAGDPNAPVSPEGGIEFRVDAVVRGDEALALVSLGGQGGIAIRSGTTLNSHVRIVEIRAGSVVIEASGKRIEVAVGEGVNL